MLNIQTNPGPSCISALSGALSSRCKHMRKARRAWTLAVAATLLVLVCGTLCSYAQSGTISDTSAIALSQSGAGSPYTAVLNSDSSVGLLQNGAVTGLGCPAFNLAQIEATYGNGTTPGNYPLLGGAIYFDAANSRGYLAMLIYTGVDQLFTTYETISGGGCTQGPFLEPLGAGFGQIEIDADVAQGNFYVLGATSSGAQDTLFVLPTTPSSTTLPPALAALPLDISATYGPIVIDSSNHQVYINDFGSIGQVFAGTISTQGFFVYDPKQSTTPANNLQHVVGYVSGGSTTPFNVGTILSNNAGTLALVNENPFVGAPTLTTPITILDTSEVSFFNDAVPSGQGSGSVYIYISPTSGLSAIAATAQYTAIGAADIDAANGFVYAFGYIAQSPYSVQAQSGILLQYNLTPFATTPENILAQNLGLPPLYATLAPWSQLSYNSASAEILLSASYNGSSALSVTSPVCAGPSFALNNLVNSAGTPTSLGLLTVNDTSGYAYATEPYSIVYVAPPPSSCTAVSPLQVSTTSLPVGIVGGRYSAALVATGGSGAGYTWSITSGSTLPAGLGLSESGVITGTPTFAEPITITVQVTDSKQNQASETFQLIIDPAFTITTNALPAGAVRTAYTAMLTATGGSGAGYSWTVTSGTALSAAGLNLNSDGTISGTPSTSETAVPVTIQVTDSQGHLTTKSFSLTIAPATVPINIVDTEVVDVADVVSVQVVPPAMLNDTEVLLVNDVVSIEVTNSSGQLLIAPSSYNYGEVAVGETSPVTYFKVKNGSTTATVGNLGSTNLEEFDLQQGNCPLVNGKLMLDPNQGCTFSAAFKPTMAGTVRGNLSIQTSSGTFKVLMSGTGVIQASGTFSINPSSGDFGEVTVGKTSRTLSFTATNNTTAAARYLTSSGSANFKVQPGKCGLVDGDPTIEPGASCIFTAEFAPTANGPATGSIIISTGLGLVYFQMSGTGVGGP